MKNFFPWEQRVILGAWFGRLWLPEASVSGAWSAEGWLRTPLHSSRCEPRGRVRVFTGDWTLRSVQGPPPSSLGSHSVKAWPTMRASSIRTSSVIAPIVSSSVGVLSVKFSMRRSPSASQLHPWFLSESGPLPIELDATWWNLLSELFPTVRTHQIHSTTAYQWACSARKKIFLLPWSCGFNQGAHVQTTIKKMMPLKHSVPNKSN